MTTDHQTTNSRRVQQVLLGTVDPTVRMDGKPIPAMTTLLYRVCGNDPDKFEEATRLVELFIVKAMQNEQP